MPKGNQLSKLLSWGAFRASMFVLPWWEIKKYLPEKQKPRRAGHHTMWSLQSKEKMEKKQFPGDSKVIWPFQGVKWPPTRDDKGTLNHLVLIILPNQKLPWKTSTSSHHWLMLQNSKWTLTTTTQSTPSKRSLLHPFSHYHGLVKIILMKGN